MNPLTRVFSNSVTLLGTLTLLVSADLQAQTQPWLGLIPVVEHTEGELAGMTTYRLYLYTLNADDFLSSCSGDDQNQWILTSTASPAWYQSAAATTAFATDINPAFFPTFPELIYDSWLTIGAEDNTAAVDIISVADPSYNAFTAFENGENVVVDTPVGNAWFVLNTPSNVEAVAGEDLRILVAQLTTAGEIAGQIQVQLFYNGSNQNEFREVLPILNACNDPEALNYEEASFNTDGCVYPEVDGVVESVTLESLEVFPLPASSEVTVRFPEASSGACVWGSSVLQALTLGGSLAREWPVTGPLMTLDISTLPAGHYTLSCQHAAAIRFKGALVVTR
ncbi:MAG: hypothetical protein O3B70_04355 [Bacteroidetes bacterium]|nr:hypothetical protein [Bacteroidota bacterium]MDA0903548.1 hypothetical protein [Bacteroidota bacterium]MDA1242145.1 hypothetical protein [Bacteroidota bacterium]